MPTEASIKLEAYFARCRLESRCERTLSRLLSHQQEGTTLNSNKSYLFPTTQYAAGRGNWAIKDVVIRQAPLEGNSRGQFRNEKSYVWSYPHHQEGC